MDIQSSELIKAINAKRSRRAALRSMSLGALSVGAFGIFDRQAKADAPGHDQTDVNILNFALNLEYLEAQYYTYATTGAGLPAAMLTGTGTEGMVVIKNSSPLVPFTPSSTDFVEQYANEIATDEQDHVNFLRTALGSYAVAMPNIDLLNSFNGLAAAAFGAGTTFDPFASELDFLIGAYIFEDVGVTAYHGAAALINNKPYLTAAAGILGTEAYHAGLIRTLLFERGPTADFVTGVTIDTATALISELRAYLSNTAPPPPAVNQGDDQGIAATSTTLPGGLMSNIVPHDTNGLVFARNTRQVLNIVYGAINTKGGLFFPDGMNGAIH